MFTYQNTLILMLMELILSITLCTLDCLMVAQEHCSTRMGMLVSLTQKNLFQKGSRGLYLMEYLQRSSQTWLV